MKKQLLSTLLALCMVLALTACGGKSDTPSDSDSSKDTQQTQQTQNTEASDKKSKDLAASITAETAEAWGVCGADMEWYYQNNILVLRGTGTTADYEDHVQKSEMPWADYQEQISRVIVEDGCTRLGDYAFSRHSNATSIVLPDSLKEIGKGTFVFCTNLSGIVIPDSVEILGPRVFRGCTSLSNIQLGTGLRTIGENVFAGCELHTIDLPESLESIDDEAFYQCKQLQTISLPEGLKSIGNGVFHECEQLQTITIPDSITSIGIRAFEDCDNLKTIYYSGDRLEDAIAEYPNINWVKHAKGSWNQHPTAFSYTNFEIIYPITSVLVGIRIAHPRWTVQQSPKAVPFNKYAGKFWILSPGTQKRIGSSPKIIISN